MILLAIFLTWLGIGVIGVSIIIVIDEIEGFESPSFTEILLASFLGPVALACSALTIHQYAKLIMYRKKIRRR